jgi:GH15 family glucan-1,4-alpha-glucosidase
VRLGPVRRAFDARRRVPDAAQGYLPGTMVARTVTRGPGWATELTDLLPWPGSAGTPPGRVVRVLRALGGAVDAEVEVVAGADYGPAAGHRLARWSRGIVTGPVQVRAGGPLDPVPLGRDRVLWRGTRRLEAGEAMVVTLDRPGDDHHRPLSPDAALRLVGDTAAAWRSWAARLAYTGPYRDAVERSALVVRALTWSPGGAAVDAGTAGLPRRTGGERNADGRVVSLRVAAAAARALARLGLDEDAEAAEAWLRGAVEGAPLPWPARRDVEGGPLPGAGELPVAGWRRSQPVTVGWTPVGVDHDVVGDVVRAISASTATVGGAGPLTGAWPALAAAADRLADHWAEPDVGVWGLGGPRRRLVASHLQAWAALDGMARRAWAANPLDLDAVPWHRAAAGIVAWCEAEGLAPDGGLQLAAGPDADPDAALLRVAWTGPWPPEHPIVARTVDRVLERLSAGSLVLRHPPELDDGVGGGDSPDVEASLWAVRALARLGRWEEAHERMEAVCALGGTTGLLAAAADPVTGELLGNLPAAGAHLALVEAAVALSAGPT